MCTKIPSIVIALTLAVGFIACGPRDIQPRPDPDPSPQPSTQLDVPAPPEGTDYLNPGAHGNVGVEARTQGGITDVDAGSWREAGGIMGSLQSEMSGWDTVQDLEACPVEPIYVFASGQDNSDAQCADGVGYGSTCRNAERRAWNRAVNVVRSCESVPNCSARVIQTGQEWYCSQVPGAEWVRDCWTQYKLVCSIP